MKLTWMIAAALVGGSQATLKTEKKEAAETSEKAQAGVGVEEAVAVLEELGIGGPFDNRQNEDSIWGEANMLANNLQQHATKFGF